MIRAHASAAGAPTQKGGQKAEALGRSRGGFSSKLNIATLIGRCFAVYINCQCHCDARNPFDRRFFVPQADGIIPTPSSECGAIRTERDATL